MYRMNGGHGAKSAFAHPTLATLVSRHQPLSERSYHSRNRYFSWVGKNGPTGKERIIYGTYTIAGSVQSRPGGLEAEGWRNTLRHMPYGLYTRSCSNPGVLYNDRMGRPLPAQQADEAVWSLR